jgi:hypothetical protein
MGSHPAGGAKLTGQTMPAKNEHLHGNAPDKASVALLLIDVINDLEFSEGEQLLP